TGLVHHDILVVQRLLSPDKFVVVCGVDLLELLHRVAGSLLALALAFRSLCRPDRTAFGVHVPRSAPGDDVAGVIPPLHLVRRDYRSARELRHLLLDICKNATSRQPVAGHDGAEEPSLVTGVEQMDSPKRPARLGVQLRRYRWRAVSAHRPFEAGG